MAKIIISLLLAFLCYGAIAALSSATLISPWFPIGTAFAFAAITGTAFAPKWEKFTSSGKFILNYLCHLVAVTGILSALFYIPNYVFADASTSHTVKAVVERRYTETRYKSKRIRRNVYGKGEPYKVYYMELRFENGMKKARHLNQQKYNRIRKGDTITVDISQGAFHVPVIKK
ncbi:MAG: hypothetical protein NC421_04065 [Lachnospiraceae bacterium]|nr:hypothetical protein [Lachnospiraceae bacterium]